jgi:hypothetical protein
MVEQVPLPDGRWQALDLVLHHQPNGKSYGFRNVLFRRQAYHWRRVIAHSLLLTPDKLPTWRWESTQWPLQWEQIRVRPLCTGLVRLCTWPIYAAREALRHRELPYISLIMQSAIHHFLICIEYMRARRSNADRTPDAGEGR